MWKMKHHSSSPFRCIAILAHTFLFLGPAYSEPEIVPGNITHNTTTTAAAVDNSTQTTSIGQSSLCSDNKKFRFVIESGFEKKCKWFRNITVKREAKIAKYCKNIEVAKNCRLSCGFCSINAITTDTSSTFGNESFAPWSFVVFADIHGLTPFSFDPLDESLDTWRDSLDILKNIKQSHVEDGGEIVLLPGDVLSFGGLSNRNIVQRLGQNLSETDSIYRASTNCYKTTRELFRQAGYGTVLAAVGDHELGGNNGFRVGKKLPTVPTYREGFASGWNANPSNGEYVLDDSLMMIMGVPSRPLGTPFQGSSFAYRYKNALFVSVDAFALVGDGDENFLDRERGLGGEGAITCDVTGDHLVWFESLLRAARSDGSTIRHIFVQAHLPIIQPVRKVKCSVSVLHCKKE